DCLFSLTSRCIPPCEVTWPTMITRVITHVLFSRLNRSVYFSSDKVVIGGSNARPLVFACAVAQRIGFGCGLPRKLPLTSVGVLIGHTQPCQGKVRVLFQRLTVELKRLEILPLILFVLS